MRLAIGASVVAVLLCVSSPFKKLENSAVGFWKSWVHRILEGRPFSIRDCSEQKVLGASTPIIRQTNLSQRLRETPLKRTFGLAGLTQMDLVHTSKRGVRSCWKETFCDSVVSGPATALTVCRKMLQNGGDRKRWFAQWAREFFIGRKDRASHEMHTLMAMFYQAGCYDQLNMGASACMELVSRRLQQHVETFAHGVDAPTGPVQNTSLAAAPLLTWCHWRCVRTQVVSVERRQSLNTFERQRKQTQLAPALG